MSHSELHLKRQSGTRSRWELDKRSPPSSQQAWYCGINLMNLDNIKIEKVVVVNTPAYHFRFSNVGSVAVSGCVMKSRGLSTDGLHFDGPANDITNFELRLHNRAYLVFDRSELPGRLLR